MNADDNNNNDDNEEELLRARFRDLRRHDPPAPVFETMWRRPPARSPFRVLVPVASVMAVAAAVIVYCRPPSASAPASPVAIGGESPAEAPVARVSPSLYEPLPLDFLLETNARPLRGW